MIHLRNFNEGDIEVLKRMSPSKTENEILTMLKEWNSLEFNGKYSEKLAICEEGTIVGCIFLYQHNEYIISAGPEILEEYRCKGYAYEAMKQAYDYAKRSGYKIATAQIRKDNIASIRLHEKLGFILDCEMLNKRGNEVFIYIKLL
ncbi:MAG: GNAT family N-acetyltransferase [Clostridia bacterium]|nr:GNAT family N-acetyltransferase [Clostridia bacterium]